MPTRTSTQQRCPIIAVLEFQIAAEIAKQDFHKVGVSEPSSQHQWRARRFIPNGNELVLLLWPKLLDFCQIVIKNGTSKRCPKVVSVWLSLKGEMRETRKNMKKRNHQKYNTFFSLFIII
jgi:hypothetical protein